MKIRSLMLSLVIFFTILAFHASSQQAKPDVSGSNGYEKQWKKADSLSELGLPKSALEVVDKIYSRAKKEKDDGQFIKAVIYRMKLQSDYREETLSSTIRDLRTEIKTASEPNREILNSLLAEVYWRYYQNNRYKFSSRTQVFNNSTDSIQTWDLQTLAGAIIRTYKLSLENGTLLKSIPVTGFAPILQVPEKGEKIEHSFRPTLYDFLAWRAMDYYTTGSWQQKVSGDAFRIANPAYFSQAAQFSPMKIPSPKDSTTLDYLALRLYLELAAFHLADKDPRALIDEELNRFDFLHNRSVADEKDSLYFSALKTLEKNWLSSPCSADVSFEIAQFLHEQGTHYDPLVSEGHKWDLKNAKEVCDEAIRRFPDSDGAKNCRVLTDEITSFSLSLEAAAGVIPDKPSPGLISFRNVPVAYFRLIAADPEMIESKTAGMSREDQVSFYTGLPVSRSWSVTLPLDGDFQSHKMDIRIPELSAGYYIILCSSDKDFRNKQQAVCWVGLFATQLSYISQENDKKGYDFYILGREAGKPLKNVTAEAFRRDYNYRDRKYETRKTGDYRSDASGFFSVPAIEKGQSGMSFFLKIHLDKDLLITPGFFQYTPEVRESKPFLVTTFFTDRAIYRPGQTIYFKGILLEKTGDKSVLKTSAQTTVTFRDVNFQKIAEQTFTTNEYGSFNGSFVAPQGVLAGQMTITNNSGSATVRVEEYKRPTFEVVFNPLEGNYKLNDSILVTGKALAYAGNTIDGANVNYSVTRSSRRPYGGCYWCPLPFSPTVQITNGTIQTRADGSFSFRFPAIPDRTLDRSMQPVFDYELSVDVTDINGETQMSRRIVSVGYTSLMISLDIPEQLNIAADSVFKLSATNLNLRKTPAVVTVLFERLKQPGRLFRDRQWEKPDLQGFSKDDYYGQFPYDVYGDDDDPSKWPAETTLSQREMNSATDSLLSLQALAGSMPRVKPGYYRITLKATDPSGMKIKTSKEVIVFDPVSKEIPVTALNWFVPLTHSGEPGEKAKFLIGSAEEDVNVIYEVRVKDSLCSRQPIKLSKNQALVEVPILESYRGNFSVNFVFIRHNQAFQNTSHIIVPYSNKRLDITYSTFRSKLDPGKDEEWKIRITGASKKGITAEFLTAMYDASLDALASNDWNFQVYKTYPGTRGWDIRDAFKISAGTYYPTFQPDLDYHFRTYDQLNWFGFSYFPGRFGRNLKMGVAEMRYGTDEKSSMNVGGNDAALPSVAASVADETVQVKTGEKGVNPAEAKGPEPEQFNGVRVRRDFRETAFFYPALVSDSAGDLSIRFTAPESLTRWKILSFTHTKDLSFGLSVKEAMTQKDLMVFPNAPRFVRQGDTVIFSAKVSNLSDRSLSGDVIMEILDPYTSGPLTTIIPEPYGSNQQNPPGASLPFTIALGQSASFQWKMVIPVDPSLSVFQYRIVAKAGSFSDGEEKVIPVLTNRMMVTESLPLPVNGKGTFDYHFDKLLNSQSGKTLKNYRLTLEFASNPAWYAVQALPTLDDPKFPNADNIFEAFYANSIASFIANSDPKIRQVFDSWKRQNPDALLSNLEKNQDLKSSLLQETPWVMEAKDESQRKQRIALLFDVNTLGSRLDQNLDQLRKLQKENGAWPWFQGMQESRYITQDIVTGLGHLDHLGVRNIRENKEAWNMLVKAVGYLDAELARDWDWLKKHVPDKMGENHLGPMQIQYLYARSYFIKDIPVASFGESRSATEAIEYYKNQAASYWLKNDLYLQGMIGLALNRMGDKEVPGMILRSFNEKALHSPEMGMYWAAGDGYEWYQAPVEAQAMMIEAFDEIASDRKAVDEMKIWLLKQKQTEDWKTGKATAEACYALLLRGTGLLGESPEVRISLGKTKVDSKNLADAGTEAGTGYFRISWNGSDISPDMGKISVTKGNDGIAWGALYWQYFENLDKITVHQAPLKIDKKLYLESPSSTGPVLKEIGNSAGIIRTLKTGDKLTVRIILSVDRDLDFVHMKDMRASGFEPVAGTAGGDKAGVLSGFRYQGGLGYYQSTTDVSTNFFFDHLPKGTWVFEYPLVVNASGDYSNGITTVQCMYAPEFAAHSEGIRVEVR